MHHQRTSPPSSSPSPLSHPGRLAIPQPAAPSPAQHPGSLHPPSQPAPSKHNLQFPLKLAEGSVLTPEITPPLWRCGKSVGDIITPMKSLYPLRHCNSSPVARPGALGCPFHAHLCTSALLYRCGGSPFTFPLFDIPMQSNAVILPAMFSCNPGDNVLQDPSVTCIFYLTDDR